MVSVCGILLQQLKWIETDKKASKLFTILFCPWPKQYSKLAKLSFCVVLRQTTEIIKEMTIPLPVRGTQGEEDSAFPYQGTVQLAQLAQNTQTQLRAPLVYRDGTDFTLQPNVKRRWSLGCPLNNKCKINFQLFRKDKGFYFSLLFSQLSISSEFPHFHKIFSYYIYNLSLTFILIAFLKIKDKNHRPILVLLNQSFIDLLIAF